jgi:hypothetical protein
MEKGGRVKTVEVDWLFIFRTNMHFFLLSYTLLGAGIKYIEGAYHQQTFNKKIAFALAPFFGVLWAYTMIINLYSATILFAILLGMLLRGKINNKAFLIGFFIILIIILPVGLELLILPLVLLTAAALLDELGNDVINYNEKYFNNKRFRYRLILYFFGRRYVLKGALLYVVLLGVFPLYFLIAFILFDEAYIFVEMYYQSR